MRKIIFSLVLAGFILSSSTIVKAEGMLRDVPNSHWASDSVHNLVNEYEIMQGTGQGYFSGGKNTTRYEMATTLDRLMKFYNAEFKADREDLSNLAGIMEDFQVEMNTWNAKVKRLEGQLAAANQKIATLETEGKILEKRQTLSEDEIFALEESGFFLDKVVKGSLKDLEHVFEGFEYKENPKLARRQAFRRMVEKSNVAARVKSPARSADSSHYEDTEVKASMKGAAPSKPAKDPYDEAFYDEILEEIE